LLGRFEFEMVGRTLRRHRALPWRRMGQHCTPTSAGTSNLEAGPDVRSPPGSRSLFTADSAALKTGDFQRLSLISTRIPVLRPIKSPKSSSYLEKKSLTNGAEVCICGMHELVGPYKVHISLELVVLCLLR
jgi:hypothetical protein